MKLPRRHKGRHSGAVGASLGAAYPNPSAWLSEAPTHALSIFQEHREDRRYQAPYLAAYRGEITYEEADQQILALAAMDEAGEEE